MVVLLRKKKDNYVVALGLEPHLPLVFQLQARVRAATERLRCAWPCDNLAVARLRAVEQVSLIKP